MRLLGGGLRVVTHVATSDPVVALTFDDGPDPVYTPQTLQVLKQHGALATFFMVGEGASRYPEVVRQVAADGHVIGNHSWDHREFASVSSLECCRQLRKGYRASAPYCRRLFRPPYGSTSRRSNLVAFLCGYRIIGWSLDVADWLEKSPEVMLRRLVEQIRPGAIILLHDRLFVRNQAEEQQKRARGRVIERESMLAALNEMLKRLSGKFEFVTIPALLTRGPALPA